MPRRIEEFWASASAQERILDKHEITLEEAESSPVYQPVKAEPQASLNATGEKRYLVAGKTDSSKQLWIVFADEGDGRGRIIAAREAQGRAERVRHKSMKGD
ncbi:MAG: BrnT family toxin [Armatimonadia bacterium]